jgi:hypothetical protein
MSEIDICHGAAVPRLNTWSAGRPGCLPVSWSEGVRSESIVAGRHCSGCRARGYSRLTWLPIGELDQEVERDTASRRATTRRLVSI